MKPDLLNQNDCKQEPHIRPSITTDTINGLKIWLGLFAYFIEPFLTQLNDHTYNLAKLLHPQSGYEYDLILYSHGLRGNAEIYNNFCSQMASEGKIVVSFNHLDGSGLWNTRGDGSLVEFINPLKEIIDKRDSQVFRKPFLDHRIKEILQIVDYILSIKEEHNLKENSKQMISSFNKKESDQKLGEIFGNMSDKITLTGHSFGGATMLEL